MACELATVQDGACTSGIGKLTDEIQLLQVIAQLQADSALAADPTLDITPDAIMERACESGIGEVTSPIELYQLIAQLLCDQA